MVKRIGLTILSLLLPWGSSSNGHGNRSNFRGDLNKSEVFQEYLDRYVYPKMMPLYDWTYERVVDRDRQNSGIDLILQHGDRYFNVDEKSQIEYLDDKNIPTMAFEVSYYKNSILHIGWLFDPQKITNLFFYVTNIKTRSGKGTFNKPEDILSCSIYCVGRAPLLNKLAAKGFNYDSCLSYYNANQIAGTAKMSDLYGAKLMLSGHKAESPLNLVIHRSTLEKSLGQGCRKIWDQDIEKGIKKIVK